jgi:hypothetical protein
MGFPQGGWWDFATLTAGKSLVDLTGSTVPFYDRSYVDDFWSRQRPLRQSPQKTLPRKALARRPATHRPRFG